MANNLPNPESREESYLAKAAGVSGTQIPEKPLSRKEQYLNAIANNGGGGGGGINVVQTTGSSTTDVMSQKAVTDALASAGGGAIHVLTSDDINYDYGSGLNAIATWLLEPGLYEYRSGTTVPSVWLTTDGIFSEATDIDSHDVLILVQKSGNRHMRIWAFGGNNIYTAQVYKTDGSILDEQQFVTFSYAQTIAAQTRAELIMRAAGAPTVDTEASDVGTIYIDEETADTYQCTAIDWDIPAYTWTKRW